MEHNFETTPFATIGSPTFFLSIWIVARYGEAELCQAFKNLFNDLSVDWNFYTEYVNRECCITCINIYNVVNTWCRLMQTGLGECKQLGRQERELGGMMGGY